MKKLLVILMVLVFVAPAMAAEWNFYGSSRITSVWYDRDKEQTAGTSVGRGAGGMGLTTDGVNDDTDLRFGLHNNSRIGAKVKASDQVSGRFEYSSTPTLRLLYGEYNFGAGKLLVGQNYRPSFFINSTSIANVHGANVFDDTNLLAHGTPYNSRDPQVRLTFGGFAIAFVTPNTAGIAPYTATDTLIPAIDLAYDIKTSMVNVKIFGGFQTYDIETTGVGQTSETVTAYLLGANAQFKFGPAYVKVGGYWAQNGGNYGIALPNGGSAGASAALIGTNVEDSTGYGAQLVVGAKVGSMVRVEAGYGYVTNEVDTAPGVSTEDDSSHIYIQAPITLAKGVTIYPEIGMLDDGDLEVGATSTPEGKATYYGFKFQINF